MTASVSVSVREVGVGRRVWRAWRAWRVWQAWGLVRLVVMAVMAKLRLFLLLAHTDSKSRGETRGALLMMTEGHVLVVMGVDVV